MKYLIYSREAPRIPAGAFYLKRLHIQKILGDAMQSPVITVSAGEGYGKTWAVYSSLLNSDSINFWIQVSEKDNDADHLWKNKNNTISLYSPELGNGLIKMGFPGTSKLFDQYHELVERVKTPGKRYVLVYDDFHLIHNTQILDFLNMYLASPPPHVSTILIHRGEINIKNVSLLSKGLLIRIREEDLQFSREETAEYFEGQHISLTKEDLDHIHHTTEGWPLILNLIARDAKNKKPGEKAYSPELMKIKSAKLIEDGFFSSLHPDMRKLVIKASLMKRRPRELLEKLGLKEEFAARIDSIGPMIYYDPYIYGYRIHTMFLEFLQEKQSELSPEETRQVYTVAAAWFLENGLRTEAALYYGLAGDCQGVFKMVYSFPGLMPAKTAIFFMDLIGRLLEENKNSEEDYLVLLRYSVWPKLIFAQGRFEEASAECHKNIKQFESLPLNALNAKILVMNYTCLGSIILFTCRFAREYRFLPTFEKALYYYEKYPFRPEEALTKCGIPSYVCQVGYPIKAEKKKDVFETSIRELIAIEPYAAKILNGFLSGTGSLAWAELYYFKGDINAAEKYARQAVFQAREKRQYEAENRGLFFLLRISIHTGDLEEIENIFRQLESQLDSEDYFSRFILHEIVSGWFYAQIGHTDRMASWLRNSFEKSELSDLFRPFETLVKLKCAYAEKRYSAVLQILETQNDRGGIESYYFGKLEAVLLKSVSRFHLGSTRMALMDLEQAYRIASPYSFDMPFIELGEDMCLLANMAVLSENNSTFPEWFDKIQNRASAYGKKIGILAESFRQPGRDQALEQSLPEDPPIPILRRREAAVLQALSQGFTREEIARKEQISFNAVKEDIKNLYDKLGALNRADAIRIANSMGLLRKFENSSHKGVFRFK
jgi:LuxR family maltose regulon positive regulatory protein